MFGVPIFLFEASFFLCRLLFVILKAFGFFEDATLNRKTRQPQETREL